MDPILEKLLQPSIVWVFIPVTAILFWGLTRVIRALRGEPDDFGEWKTELQQLRKRVETLEAAQQPARPGEVTAHSH